MGKTNSSNIPIYPLFGMMATHQTVVGTCTGEVVRDGRNEMVWVSLVKGGKIGTLDGMFGSDELRRIADWLDFTDTPPPPPPDQTAWKGGEP